MAISTGDISALVAAYLARHPDEAGRLAPLSAATGRDGDLTARSTLPGHVTTGAFLLDAEGRLLQIAHKSLGRWLNPGGHVEASDPDLLAAARRELAEETGIEDVRPHAGVPLDIDVHQIPANDLKGEPEHWHYDFRYVFHLVGAGDVELQEEEVAGHRWIPVAEADLGLAAGKLAAVTFADVDRS